MLRLSLLPKRAALNSAFDRVDRFQLTIMSPDCIEILVQVIIEVTPGLG